MCKHDEIVTQPYFYSNILYFNKQIYCTVLQQLSSPAYVIKTDVNFMNKRKLKRNRTTNMQNISNTGCIKKNATSEFAKKSNLQFLSIKDFRPLGIEIELLIVHITVVVLLNKCINFALCTRVCSNFDSCAILNSQAPKIFCP